MSRSATDVGLFQAIKEITEQGIRMTDLGYRNAAEDALHELAELIEQFE